MVKTRILNQNQILKDAFDQMWKSGLWLCAVNQSFVCKCHDNYLQISTQKFGQWLNGHFVQLYKEWMGQLLACFQH